MTTSSKKSNVGLDSNILVYLFDQKSPHNLLVQNKIEELEANGSSLIICHQNIIEFVKVLTDFYQFSLSKAIANSELILNKQIRIIHPKSHTLEIYFELCKHSNARPKRHFDYYLAATYLDNDINTLLTNNPKDFEGIKELSTIPLSK